MAGKSIAENLHHLRTEIESACVRFGRPLNSVQLIAVSKTKPIESVAEALFAGQIDFGENYVQELLEKQEHSLEREEAAALRQVRWHFIGNLQSNKVRSVVGKAALIHSVDRWRLAQEIDKAARAAGLTQEVLLQIHIGEEATKHGTPIETAAEFLRQTLSLEHIVVRGLMCLPPIAETEAESRRYFCEVSQLAQELKEKVLTPELALRFNILSMGTSHDFVAAIAEGATHVRIGTLIFGVREPRHPSD